MTQHLSRCRGGILDGNFMKCSNCAKCYNFICINITQDKFKGFTQSYKDQWLCPSCTCSQPKCDNLSTPIRAPASTAARNDTYSAVNINMTRGNKQGARAKTTRDDQMPNPELTTLLAELRQLRLELEGTDIEDVIRVGPKSSRRTTSPSSSRVPRPIVLKLLRRRKTEEVLKAAKARRNLTSEHLVDGQPMPIFFNERLTHEKRQLFREARKRSKEKGFQYCWCKNGGIYVKRADGKPAMRIFTTADMDEKVGPTNQLTGDENSIP
ncbi:hypothetical protein ACJJTC_015279 [Scirpophaga incertulas]